MRIMPIELSITYNLELRDTDSQILIKRIVGVTTESMPSKGDCLGYNHLSPNQPRNYIVKEVLRQVVIGRSEIGAMKRCQL